MAAREAVDEILKNPDYAVYHYGGAGDKDKERALAAGAVAFLYKPIDHEELLKLVRATLGAPAK